MWGNPGGLQQLAEEGEKLSMNSRCCFVYRVLLPQVFGGLWVSGAALGAGDPPLQILVLLLGFFGSRLRLGLCRDREMI